MSSCALLIGIVVLILIVASFHAIVAAHYAAESSKPAGAEGFFTEFAQEEPTRSYTPYTGTIAYGTWGTKPWAEEFTHGCTDGANCEYTNLRDVQVGTDIQPICGTCASTIPPLL